MKRISFFEVMSPLLPLPVGLLPLPLQESFIQLIATEKCFFPNLSSSRNQIFKHLYNKRFTSNCSSKEYNYDGVNKQAVKKCSLQFFFLCLHSH